MSLFQRFRQIVLRTETERAMTGWYAARIFDLSHFHPACADVRIHGSVDGLTIFCADCRVVANVEAVGRRIGWADACDRGAFKAQSLSQSSPGIEEIHDALVSAIEGGKPWPTESLSSKSSPRQLPTSSPAQTSSPSQAREPSRSSE